MTLSPRQQEALDLVEQGIGNKAIADKMGITASSVKAHLHEAFLKIGVSTRAEYLAQMLRQANQRLENTK